MKNQCLEAEKEYREWREAPLWYCVKTTFHQTGVVESEIITDEKSKLPLTFQSLQKPLDGAFETATEITYYSYHAGYKEAERQVESTKVMMRI